MQSAAPSRLHADLAHRILARLVAENAAPGHHLVELELCAAFGVSRTPVRDAIRRLHSDGCRRLRRREILLRRQSLLAIAGEGSAMAEKGALEKARRNLSRLEGLCGASCEATRQLAAVIAKGPSIKIVSAQSVTPAPTATAPNTRSSTTGTAAAPTS